MNEQVFTITQKKVKFIERINCGNHRFQAAQSMINITKATGLGDTLVDALHNQTKSPFRIRVTHQVNEGQVLSCV